MGLADAIENALGRRARPPAPVPLAGLERAVDVFDRVCDGTEVARDGQLWTARKTSRDMTEAVIGTNTLEQLSPELVLISPPEFAAKARQLLPPGVHKSGHRRLPGNCV